MLDINRKFTIGKFGTQCTFRGVVQGINQTCMQLQYPLFQAEWDKCDQQNHKNFIVLLYNQFIEKQSNALTKRERRNAYSLLCSQFELHEIMHTF